MRKWPVGLSLVTLACLGSKVHTTAPGHFAVRPPDFLFEELYGATESAPGARHLGKFKVTHYWIVEERDYPKSRSVPLYDDHGTLIGRFSSAFVSDYKRESAARLRDGRCISYLKKANRSQVVDRFLGSGGHRLVELKSIAVDPRVIPLGAKLYIPQAEKVVVNGRPSNGIFYAHDIGSAVKGKHIDVFVGPKSNAQAFASAGMRSLSSVDVYILE